MDALGFFGLAQLCRYGFPAFGNFATTPANSSPNGGPAFEIGRNNARPTPVQGKTSGPRQTLHTHDISSIHRTKAFHALIFFSRMFYPKTVPTLESTMRRYSLQSDLCASLRTPRRSVTNQRTFGVERVETLVEPDLLV